MTNIELILNMLAEAAATEVSMVRHPSGFSESAKVAVKGAEVAKTAADRGADGEARHEPHECKDAQAAKADRVQKIARPRT
jgi:hypothetical protein